MTERVGQFPKWMGGSPLRGGTSVHIIIIQELRKAYLDFWFRIAAIFVLAYAVVYLGNLYTLQQVRGDSVHTLANYMTFLENLRWGALAVGAVMAGPALLDDTSKGALELYLTRAVSMKEYLAGKITAVFLATFLALWIPGILYWLMGFVFFDQQPAVWALLPLRTAVYALIWALVVAGLGLGLSCVAKSGRGATMILFGSFAVLDIVIGNLIAGITKDRNFELLSPFKAMDSQVGWMFGAAVDTVFPSWWGLATVLGLVIVGWTLMAWKHPRVRGDVAGNR